LLFKIVVLQLRVLEIRLQQKLLLAAWDYFGCKLKMEELLFSDTQKYIFLQNGIRNCVPSYHRPVNLDQGMQIHFIIIRWSKNYSFIFIILL